MTDDELIAEFRARQQAGRFGDRALLMPSEEGYSGMWSALCSRLVEWEHRFGFDNPVVHEVRSEMQRLADARPDAVKVFALATARYGREDGGGE